MDSDWLLIILQFYCLNRECHYFKNFVELTYKQDKYTLRTNKTYTIPISKSTRTINSLMIKGPKLWNLLPTNIQNIKNENLFKKRVKNILINDELYYKYIKKLLNLKLI